MAETAAVQSGAQSDSRVSLELLATLDGPWFSLTVAKVTPVLEAPYGAIVLVEDGGLWFRARYGFTEAATPREGPLWDEAISTHGVFVVEDLLADPRFGGAAVTVGGVPVRFFASCVIHAQDGRPIGLYCVAGPEPREFDARNRGIMASLAVPIENQLATLHELDRAAAVQRALLPRRVPPLDGYQVAGVCVPAKDVGGDFYDWYEIDGGIAFTLADVMGKGVGASIIAATVRATIRTARRDEDVVLGVHRASEALEEDLSEAESFVTLFHGRLRSADGMISYVDAGHGLTVVLDADGTVHRLSARDLPLGMSEEDGPHPIRQPQQIVLEAGGTLVSFSDGVLDLYDGSLAAVDRVSEIARRASSAKEITEEIERLARRDDMPDDITVLAIKRLVPTER